MKDKYICAMCGNVVKKDNIKVIEHLGREVIVCNDCFNHWGEDLMCNFTPCPNCEEWVFCQDIQCNHCGYEYQEDEEELWYS